MKKKLRIIVPVVLLIILGVATAIFGSLAPIITGYTAKNLASGIFVAGRTQQSLENEDLHFSFIKYTSNRVDYDKKEVVSRFLFWTSKAVYVEGFGCTLLRDNDETTIRARRFPMGNSLNIDYDSLAWPMGERVADSIPQGIDVAKLSAVLDEAFADTLPMKGSFAVAVAYKNQLVAERYRDDFNAESRFLSWSVAKSFINTMAGILVCQDRLVIDAPTGLEAWAGDARRDITVSNLLRMNSGLDWNEDYGSNSDVNKMLFKNGDMAAYAMSKPAVARPDSLWVYSSGTTNILSYLIRKNLGNDSLYYQMPRHELFDRIGMRSAVFEVDASGTFTGSSYIYATSRDYLRYGLLYLNNGHWGEAQILPKDWVAYTTTPAAGSKKGYGAFFWLNADGGYRGVPTDMYCARGHDGQYIFIVPSKNLVVVRNGYSKKGTFDPALFLKKIIDCIE